jgi:class 3 adenylate cyclase
MAFVGGNGPSTVTVLFTDVVGSTEARVHVGADAADRLRRNHDRLLTQAVQANRGRVLKGLGDGIMATFVSATDALAAAVSAQRALARHNRSEAGTVPLAVRMGLSSGDVMFEESDCFGTPVVEASRLCDAAQGGQILASDLVRALAAGRGAHSFEFLGALDLKGLPDPLATVAVAWESDRGLGLPLPAGLEHPTAFPFVGREKECDRLRYLWGDVRAGERRVAMVAGEPGIGKTRLVGELAVSAHDEGAVVLYGRCQEEVGLPYQAFAEALRGYVAACPAERLRQQLGPLGGELVRLVPTLPDRLSGLPEPVRAEPETERYRLFESVAALLSGISVDAPVVVVLDDLHTAARPDLALLRHLLRPGEFGRILFVATYRDTEVDHDHAMAPLLASLRREPGVERITLTGLDETAVAQLLEVGAGHALDTLGQALARAVHSETDGNPFFIGEVIRDLSESGAVLRRAGADAAEQVVAELGLPEGIREIVGRRLARLPAAASEVLGVAAVIGREFDVGLLIEASKVQADEVLDALERTEQARLVVPVPGRLDRYLFEHALVRSTLLDTLPASRRTRLHRRIGVALEARRRDEDLPDLAHHFHAAGPAGDPSRAFDYALRAADQASTRLAHEQAAAYYGLALDALEWAPSARARRREALLGRAEAWRRAGEAEQARADFLAAAEEARREDDAETLARAALGVGQVSAVWGIDPVLVDLLQTALERLGTGHRPLRARVLARLGQALYFSDPDQRLDLSRRAVDEARQAGDPAALAAVLCARHVALFGADGLGERKQAADEIIRLADETGDPELALQGHAWRFVDLLELGDRQGADRDLDSHAELARSLRQPLHIRDATMWRAMVATLEGRFSEAEQLIEDTLRLGQQAHDTSADLVYTVQRGWLLMDAERSGEMPTLLESLRRIADTVPESVIPAWRASSALIAVLSGEPAAARAEFEATVDGLGSMRRDAPWLPCLVILAGACAELQDAARASVLYDLLGPYAGRILVPDRAFACRGAIDRYLGELAAILGRLDEAVGHFAAAVDLNARLGARPLLARSRCAYAEALLARRRPGDEAAAAALAADVLAAATALGMARLAARGRAVVQSVAAGESRLRRR